MLNETKADEQKRVNEVQKEIKTQIIQTTSALDKASTERQKVESTYGDTAKVNLAEEDDRMETNAAIQQQKQLVALAFENETILTNRKKHLELLDGKPYFGRIDINEDGDRESLYIGTSSLITEDDEFLVYDWRAPISSLYYNGTLGLANYDTPVGQVEVELENKRQFKIVDSEITKMFDTNDTIGDDILQDILSENSDTHMKNIVASVQQKQNEIIRDTSSDILVVQGVAGSGKTSAILQRIAYLLYHSRAKLDSDQIILFSPNNLFSNYISEVLPSLGEKNMRQVTLADFLSRRHQGFKLETLFDRFERDQNSLPAETKKIRSYKESPQFIEAIREYLRQTPSDNLPFTNLVVNGKTIVSDQEIHKIYQGISNQYPLADRFAQTKVQLIKIIKTKTTEIAASKEIEQEIEALSDREYHQLLGDKAGKFQDYQLEYEFLSYKLARRKLRPLYHAIENDFFIDIYQAYLNFLNQLEPKNLNLTAFKEMARQVADEIELHSLRINDAVGIMFLRDLLTGTGQNFNIKYLFIDEMQDYAPSLLQYLEHSFPKAKLTLLGDYAQDIFDMSETSDEDTQKISLKKIFGNRKLSYTSLNTSYRSTQPITDFGKALIKNDQIQSFTRGNQKPVLYQFDDLSKFIPLYLDLIKQELSKYKMVALITKNESQAKELADFLSDKINFSLITQKSRSLKQGLIILPIYLAKGLEFDSVIAHNISAENYDLTNTSEVLYTISSRAMHSLKMTSFGPPTNILDTIYSNLYRKNYI